MDKVQCLTTEYLKQEFGEIEYQMNALMDQKQNIPIEITNRICEITTELLTR